MMPFGPIDTEFDTYDYILPATSLSVTLFSTDISDFVTSYTCSASRGNGLSGSITIKDRDSFIADLVGSWGPANSNIRSHSMNTARTLSITAAQGGTTTNYPTLIPGDPEWDNEGTLTLPFTDVLPLIEKEDQDLGDYVSLEGDTATSHTIIATAAGLVGLTISPGFPSYDIEVFRGNNINVKSALEEIMSVTQAYFRCEGSTINLKVLPISPGSPSRHLEDRRHIPEGGMSMSKDTSNLRTYFKYFKDKTLDSVLGEASCTGKMLEESQCVGRVVQVSFNRPVSYAKIQVSAHKGDIQDGVFYSDSDTPLTSTPTFVYYGTAVDPKAAYWVGTYVPLFTMTEAYVPSWTVKAIGGPPADAEETWDLTEVIGAAESLYGRRPEYKSLESQLIKSEGVASNMMAAIGREVSWGINKLSLSTPFLCSEREGDYLRVTHHKLRLTSETCLVNGFNHSFSYEDGWGNSYDLTTIL